MSWQNYSWNVVDAFRKDGFAEVWGQFDFDTGQRIGAEWRERMVNDIGECLLAAGYLMEDDGEVIAHLWEADGDQALVYNGSLRDSARGWRIYALAHLGEGDTTPMRSIASEDDEEYSDGEAALEFFSPAARRRIAAAGGVRTLGNTLPAPAVEALRRFVSQDAYFRAADPLELAVPDAS